MTTSSDPPGVGPSPTQMIMRQLWDTEGPQDVLQILASNEVARTKSFQDSLASQCEELHRSGSNGAGVAVQIWTTARESQTAAADFAEVKDLGSLASFIRTHPLYLVANFIAYVEARRRDASAVGNSDLADRLARALEVRTEGKRLVGLLSNMKQRLSEGLGVFDEEPTLLSDGFFELLGEHAIAFRQTGDAATGLQYEKALERLTHLRQGRTEIQRLLRGAKTSSQGTIRIRMPLTAQESNRWFVGTPDFQSVAGPLRLGILDGSLQIDDAIAQLELLSWLRLDRDDRLHGLRSDTESSHIQCQLWSIQAFLTVLIGSAPEAVADSGLTRFRELLDDPRFSRQVPAVWDTAVLRFAHCVLFSWQRLTSGPTWLQEARELLDRALVASTERGARLERDLYFRRAMILENLAQEEADLLLRAAEDYRRGLSIASVSHEAEARAQGLMNLANVYRRLPTGQAPPESEILRLYKLALELLDPEAELRSRADVYGNLAIHFNERSTGDRAENQEQALHYIDKAIGAYVGTLEEEALRSPTYAPRLAHFEMTRGNILRARFYGDFRSRLKLAEGCYHSALGRLGSDEHPSRRGVIRLNLAQTLRDLHFAQSEDEGPPLDSALRNYEEAITLLEGAGPSQYQALSEHAMLLAKAASDADEEVLGQGIDKLESLYAELCRRRLDPLANETLYKLAILCESIATIESTSDIRQSKKWAEKAADGYDQVAEFYESIGAYDEAISALLDACNVLADFAEAASTEPNALMSRLEHALELGRHIREAASRVETATVLSNLLGPVYAQLLWLRAAEPDVQVQELFELSSHAKAAQAATQQLEAMREEHETPPWLRESLRKRRAALRQVEALRWSQQTEAVPGQSLFDDISAAVALRKEVEEEVSTSALGTYERVREDAGVTHVIKAFSTAFPDRWLLDVTVSRWGTVALLRQPGAEDHTVVQRLPLSRSDLDRWLWSASVDGNAPKPWMLAYQDYCQCTAHLPLRRADLERSTQHLIDQLSQCIFEPILANVSTVIRGKRLVFSGGALTSLPVHAARVGGVPLFSLLRGLARVQNASLLPRSTRQAPAVPGALCIVCETDNPPRLREAPSEVVKVGDLLSERGWEVTFVASVGGLTGHNLLRSLKLVPQPTVTVLERHPTPAWFAEAVQAFDHIVFAGHGSSGGHNGPSLHLADSAGAAVTFSLLDALGLESSTRRPLFVLSACETAHEPAGVPDEPNSLVSWLLRAGAIGVVGASWRVLDSVSAAFNLRFHQKYQGDAQPDEAYCAALAALAQDENLYLQLAPFGFWDGI